MFDVSLLYIRSSNFLEMRKPELVKVGEELYEIVRRFPISKFSVEITGGDAEFLREYYRVEKILRSAQTSEYLFVNQIQDIEYENLVD